MSIEDSQHDISNRIMNDSGVQITAVTLDELLDDLHIREPSLIKMNIEGAETAALRGAYRTLQSNARWVVSCHDFVSHLPGYESSATYSEVYAAIKESGLQISPSRVDDRPWIPFYIYAHRNVVPDCT